MLNTEVMQLFLYLLQQISYMADDILLGWTSTQQRSMKASDLGQTNTLLPDLKPHGPDML